ncbi:MAG TPA: Fe-S cluster assembly protein SufD [Trebonia sp.]|jgi:Fe-S cluster assembly protein SufD|nr:Fe-S cluster assembly protein SufD [Trebonia sp.]
MTTTLSGAVETSPVVSVHAFESTDPDAFEVPGGREEEWRFTPLRRLRALHKDVPLVSAGSSDAAGFTVEWDAAPEVTVRTADRAGASPATSTFVPANRVSARAYAAAVRATVVTVAKEAQASRPTYIRVVGQGTSAADGQATAGHLVIDVQPFGRATVVIDQRGSATYADNVEIVVGDSGDLEVISIADWAADAVQVSAHHATVGRDAHFKHVAVTLGGSLVRLSPTVRYSGPGGDAELFGICFADAGQHLEHRLFVDHGLPNCRSLVRYKAALSGDDAHAVWIGDVLIRPEATGTDTYEYNRNLVLSDNARADSVPNLEILTGEIVGAGHASANGRLEEEHLFYLMARGIPEAEARRLVVRGFFGELVDQVSVPEVRERVMASIEGELGIEAERA